MEAERRAGRPRCALTAASGERVDLDLDARLATFRLSQQTAKLRATALANAAAASPAPSPANAPAARRGSLECQVCFSAPPVEVGGCGHRAACAACLGAHARARAAGADAAAWVPCPHPGCAQLLSARVLAQPGGPGWPFPIQWLGRALTRLPEWAPCDRGTTTTTTSLGGGGAGRCSGGVLVGRANEGQAVPCPVCGEALVAERRAEEPDPEVV